MLNVFFREFKAVFRNIKSVIALGSLALLSGIFFIRNNLMTAYSEIELVLSSLTLVIALVVPLVAIFSVAKERKEGSDTFMAILPFTKLDLILGKFFGVFAACLVPLSTVAIYPLVLALMGAKSVWGSYVGVVVLYAMTAFLCALGLVAAYWFKKIWAAIVVVYVSLTVLLLLGTFSIAFESSALVAFIFFVVLSIAVGACFWVFTKRVHLGVVISALGAVLATVSYFAFPNAMVNSISVFLESISPFRRFDSLVFGLFDLSGLVFYISLCIALLWVTAVAMKPRRQRAKGQKRAPANIKTATAFAAVLVACVVINMAVSALPAHVAKMDISDNKLHSVSQSAKSFIKSLDEEITVYMIDENGADERVIEYVERYCSMSDKITVKKINTAKDTEFLAKYGLADQTLPYCSIIVESQRNNRWKLVSSEDYFVYYHEQIGYMTPSDYEYSLSVYTEMYSQYASYVSEEELATLEEVIVSLSNDSVICFCAEQSITEAIDYVSADYVPAVYFLSGRGEKNTSANPLDIRGLSRIPDDVGLLVINAPSEDYKDSDISVLLEYVERGGRIIFLADEANQDMPNVSRLLACYGLALDKGTISSSDGSNKIQAVSNTSEGTEVMLVGATAIKITQMSGVSISSLLTYDAQETDESGNIQTATRNVAVVAYKGETPAIALITGADTFNSTGTDALTEAEQEEYLVSFSFLQSVRTGLQKNFESSVSTSSPKVYATESLTTEKSSNIFFGALFAAIIPIAIVGIPLMNMYARKKRTDSE